MIDPRSVLMDKLNVSHETFNHLQHYHDLLLKWQKNLNLISPKTVNDVWDRHILDCAQICRFLPTKPCFILDVGSGAGLPGAIISILTEHKVHLVEADRRKCAFLRTVLSHVHSKAIVHEKRLEKMDNMKADIITARAFASIPKLLKLTEKQHHVDLRFFLLKGKDINSELINVDSLQKLQITNKYASITSKSGCILELQFNGII